MRYVKEFAMVIMIILLFVVMSKIDGLENKIHEINENQSEVMTRVDGQESFISATLTDFMNEQSWISSIAMIMDKESSRKNQANLEFEWQIKEWIPNSNVAFHYKLSSKEGFHSVEAINLGNGLFKAHVPVEIEISPQFYVHVSVSENTSEEVYTREKEQTIYESTLSFYVTMSNDHLVKSSDIITEFYGYLGFEKYGAIDVNVDINNDRYFVHVMSQPQYSATNYIKKAYLLIYNNGSLIEEEELIKDTIVFDDEIPIEERPVYFQRNNSRKVVPFTNFILKVVYQDGETFEKEIYLK